MLMQAAAMCSASRVDQQGRKMLEGLNGKTAIVTGAAGGIGRAIVERLVKEQCNVIAVDLNTVVADPAGSQRHVITVTADVSTENGCETYVRAAVEQFGGLDFLINNAAIVGKRVRLVDLDPADFDRVCAVNLRSVFLGMRVAIRQMLKQGRGGSIVNMSSYGGVRAQAFSSDYGTTKHAVIGLTRVAALEYGRDNVRINAVCPGGVDTPMLRPAMRTSQQDVSSFFSSNPIPRVAEPREVANLVVYLLSDEASYQTGGIYAVDGGRSI